MEIKQTQPKVLLFFFQKDFSQLMHYSNVYNG